MDPRAQTTSTETADSLNFTIWQTLVFQPVTYLSTWKSQANDVTCALDNKPETRLNTGLSHEDSARNQILPSSPLLW
jgi:hypothetical protein